MIISLKYNKYMDNESLFYGSLINAHFFIMWRLSICLNVMYVFMCACV